jgi:hypothetical protein
VWVFHTGAAISSGKGLPAGATGFVTAEDAAGTGSGGISALTNLMDLAMGFFAGVTSAGMNSLGNSKGAWRGDSVAQAEDIRAQQSAKGMAKFRGLAFNMVNHS